MGYFWYGKGERHSTGADFLNHQINYELTSQIHLLQKESDFYKFGGSVANQNH